MKNIAQSRTHIKQRVERYLWSDDSVSLMRLREILRVNFLDKAPTIVIGGLVRDLARGGVRAFKSDVDLVVDAANADVVQIAAELNAVANRFGGFSTTIGSWKIDFWALRNTWAHREGHVRIKTQADVTKCTFFTCDAIAYLLNDKILFARPEYLRDMRNNILEINLVPNPSIEGNLLRAVRRILSADMTVGPKLREFISDHMNEDTYSYVVATEKRLYNHSYAERYECAPSLLNALLFRASRSPAKAHRSSQFALPI